MWAVALGFGAKIFGAITGWFEYRERKAHERLGRQDEKLRQSEAGREASREMREIENEVEGLPASARRDLARRWVRGSEVGDGDDG